MKNNRIIKSISSRLLQKAILLIIFGFLFIGFLKSDLDTNFINQTKDKDSKYQKATNAMEALEQRRMMRAGDDGTIPFGALVHAKKHIDQMPETDDAGIWDWEWLGPGNIGGRIRTLLIHPDDPSQIWIGSASGGIWKSNNGGGSWAPVNDFMANLAITSIVMDPVNHSILYAATGEGFGNSDGLPGAGIFKSTNGGISWIQLAGTNTPSFTYINRLAHHTYISGKLYAVTAWDAGVWHSDDFGNSWTKLLSTAKAATDIKINPFSPHNLIAGTKNEVFLSGNNGATWEEQTTGAEGKLPDNPGRCEVIFSPNDSETIYVSMDRDQGGSDTKGEIWRSTDGGDSWEIRCTGYHYLGKQGWYNNTIWVSPTSNNHVIVGGIDLWRSEDGGNTLTRISRWQNYHTGHSAHADHHIIVNHPDWDGETNKTIFFGNDGGIQKVNNIDFVGELYGWTNLAGSSLGITQFYGGAATPDGSIIVGGTQDNDKLKYTPVGGTGGWYQATTGDGGYAAINYADPDFVFGEYVHLKIKRSSNAGQSYANMIYGLGDAGSSERSLFIAPFVMDPNNPAVLIAGGANLWRNSNSNNLLFSQWHKLKDDIGGYITDSGDYVYYKCSALDIAKGNSNIVWAGYTGGFIWQTQNLGVDWTRVDSTSPPLPDRVVTDIAINPYNSNEAFVCFGGYVTDNVWHTNDAGATWQQRTGTAPYDLPAIQVNTIRFHPGNTNWVYIGTDLGVFASEDKGVTWNKTPRTGEHDGPANVEVAELFWQGDHLIAATHGRGMYRCRPLSNIYVDKSSNWPGNGTFLFPYHTVTEAKNVAGPGTQIVIFGNTYDEENLIFNKRGLIKATEGSAVIK